MKFRIILLSTLILVSIVLTKCYYDSKEYLYPELSAACDTSVYTFSGAVKPILQNNCYSCHSNSNAASFGKNVKLEDYADVKNQVDIGALIGSITRDPKYIPMPYNGGSLSTCNIAVIQKWVNAQAPNN